MKSLLDSGIEVTALHNHLFNARPATFYMHIGGMGNPVNMADAIHTAKSRPTSSSPRRRDLITCRST